MALLSGQMLTHYRLTERIGEGGMGVVWKAEDTRLSRDVAIKVLSEAFSQDTDRLARFEREAKLLASLNHTNIAAVYGLDEADGVRFLVLELIPGDTLAERIERGPLQVESALDLARQIAEALEAAHGAGVVHRDLKPANVKVTPDERVKVLDFGLAKAFAPDASSQDLSLSPTLTTGGTAHGVILGTAAYMSPEQARGRPVDKRTDVWALGCLLFEMLTGRKVFGGETASDTIAAILKSEPDWASLPGGTPPRLGELLSRCLEKDARNRFHDIADARIELERCLRGDDASGILPAPDVSAATPPPAPRRRGGVGSLIGAGLAGAALGALIWSQVGSGTGPGAPAAEAMRLSIEVPGTEPIRGFTISPDGRWVAYRQAVGPEAGSADMVQRLFVRPLDAFESRALPDSDRVLWASFSPDSRTIAYFVGSQGSSGGRILRASLDGGPSIMVASLDQGIGTFMSGAWFPDGSIIFPTADGSGIGRVPATGGSAETVRVLDQTAQPSVFLHVVPLPDADRILATIGFVHREGLRSRVEVIDLTTGEGHEIMSRGWIYALLPGEQAIFTRGDATLRAARMDPATLEIVGPERPLHSLSEIGNFALSTSGTLVHVPPLDRTLELVSVDRDESLERLAKLDGAPGQVHWSPDGKRVSVRLWDEDRIANRLWVFEHGRTSLNPLPFDGGFIIHHTWMPGGEELLFSALNETEQARVFRQRVSGGARRELFPLDLEASESVGVSDISRDGSLLVLESNDDIWLVPARDDARPVPFLAGPAVELGPKFSPDGIWLAYDSDEAGRREVFVTRVGTGDEGAGSTWRVSRDGGQDVVWAPDGEELFFESPTGALMVAAFGSGTAGAPTVGEPRLVLDIKELGLWEGGRRSYDVSPDGDRFVFFREQGAAPGPRPIRVVVNWFQDVVLDVSD